MPNLPACVNQDPIPGLKRIYQGKVRDTYALPNHPELLLVVASDRLSIFDFVLPAFVPQKGEILTAMNTFWRKEDLGNLFSHDLVACGSAIDSFLSEPLRGNTDLQKRATIVCKLHMLPVEAIVRGMLTGSGLKAYHEGRVICGHRLPEGLGDGDELPSPIFTPTTKADEGHDEHVTAVSVTERFGVELERLSLQLFMLASAYARERGIVLADTKFEFGINPENTCLTVGDEVLTPDSSRFWNIDEWVSRPRGTSPSPYDKQLVREWGKKIGIHRRDPASAEDVAWVHSQAVPQDLLARTTAIYRYIFWRLAGQKLEAFQREKLGIDVKPQKIVVISGSDSDLPQMGEGIEYLLGKIWAGEIEADRHVISCHRNPTELYHFAERLQDGCVVIAGAGMAAALPGILKARLVELGKSIPVIGVGFAGDNGASEAARLSIEQLPGRPVVLKPDGTAYFGPEGFADACRAAVEHEFLPAVPRESKPAQFDLPLVPSASS